MDAKNELSNTKINKAIPFSARFLGSLGLIPFIGLTCLMVFGLEPGVEVSFLLRTYSAIILSFLGGIHWGIATQSSLSENQGSIKLSLHLTLSVIPSLLGWVGLFVFELAGFCIIIFGFVLALAIDLRIAQMNFMPEWYPRLRTPLTVTVVGCLVIASVLKF